VKGEHHEGTRSPHGEAAAQTAPGWPLPHGPCGYREQTKPAKTLSPPSAAQGKRMLREGGGSQTHHKSPDFGSVASSPSSPNTQAGVAAELGKNHHPLHKHEPFLHLHNPAKPEPGQLF